MRLTEIHTTLDTRGQFVPVPVVRSELAMRQVPAGGILEVVATGLGTVPDVKAWVNARHHELIDHRQDGDNHWFYVRKS